MLTDDQLAERIGPRLHAELDGVQPGHDPEILLSRLRSRRARQTWAVRGGVVALPLAAAATAIVLAAPASSGGPVTPPRSSGHSQPGAEPSGSTIRLDGYVVAVPAGMKITRDSHGFVVTKGSSRMYVSVAPHTTGAPGLPAGWEVTLGTVRCRQTGAKNTAQTTIPSATTGDGSTCLVVQATGPGAPKGVASFVHILRVTKIR
jgi:hypothetical protein